MYVYVLYYTTITMAEFKNFIALLLKAFAVTWRKVPSFFFCEQSTSFHVDTYQELNTVLKLQEKNHTFKSMFVVFIAHV